MNEHPIQSVIILGGGTAAWLTANHLAVNLKPKLADGVKITVIESPNTPTIGVGEGTVPLMAHTLKEFGISETDFIRRCDVSFKQGIQFNGWNKPIAGQQHSYYHPFDYPILDADNLSQWLSAQDKPFSHAFGSQAALCDSALAPKTACCKEYQGLASYGYHLDAGKFSELLAEHAQENLGVEYISAHIDEVTLDDSGAIEALIDTEHTHHHADLFIDCSGFCSRLLGQAMGVGFKDKSDVLFVNKALALQLPYDEPEPVLPSCTLSTAQSAGWIWDIALPSRKGVGHVFCDKYISSDEAHAQLAAYVNKDANSISPRLIDMKVGYRERFWHKNCVAIGLAQGFVEPLEATGLLVFDATAKLLAKQFPTHQHTLEPLAERFNQRVSGMWESVIRFIKLHYAISNRDDSDFWLDNRNPKSWPEALKNDLAHWQYQMPSHYDFNQGFDTFRLENYLYVLYGMNYGAPNNAQLALHHNPNMYNQLQDAIASRAAHHKSQLKSNRALIKNIMQNGMSKV